MFIIHMLSGQYARQLQDKSIFYRLITDCYTSSSVIKATSTCFTLEHIQSCINDNVKWDDYFNWKKYFPISFYEHDSPYWFVIEVLYGL